MNPVVIILRMRELGADDVAVRVAQQAMGAFEQECKGCGAVFLVGPGTGNGPTLRWCSPACYQRNYKRVQRAAEAPRDYRTEWERTTGVSLMGGPSLENALWRHDIRSMQDLAKLSATDILRIPNVGRTSLRYIQEALVEHNMRTRDDARQMLAETEKLS